jgi:hypothetical protein
MQCAARPAVLLFIGLLAAKPICAQHGFGGGHISGGFSGHSAGHAMGSSIGHSFGHVFGHRGGRGKGGAFKSGRAEEPPVAGAAIVKGKLVQMPGPAFVVGAARPPVRHDPFEGFPFRHRFDVFPFQNQFGFGFCQPFSGFGLRRHHFLLDDNFDCFGGGFFIDSLFFGSFSENLGFDGTLVGQGALGGNRYASAAASVEDASSSSFRDSAAAATKSRVAEGEGLPAGVVKDERPSTLLVLLEGSMYGLTDYWLQDDRLHYVTTYGAQNSVPIESIDFEKTFQANEERGIEFAPRLRTAPQ